MYAKGTKWMQGSSVSGFYAFYSLICGSVTLQVDTFSKVRPHQTQVNDISCAPHKELPC